MLQGGITFGTSISTDYTKFQAQPGHVYRAAVLHYVDENNTLQPIMRVSKTHFHATPEGVQGLGGFFCLSTDDTVAECCKNTGMFGDPLYKIAIPIVLYPTSFQGDIIPGGAPDVQIIIVYERGWTKLNQINKTYALSANDFQISGKKQGRGVTLDFMPAGPAYWQTDQNMFAALLSKAKVMVEGPGLASIDKMLGRKVSLIDVSNAIRQASGLPPSMPAMAPMPPMPPMPMGNNGMLMPPPAAAPAPIPPMVAQSPTMLPPVGAAAMLQAPAAPQMAMPTGPASSAQLAALGSLLAPPSAALPDGPQ